MEPPPRSIGPGAPTRRRASGGGVSGRRRRLVRLALVFAGGVLLFDALAGEKGLVEMMRARQEQQALERELLASRRGNDRLRGEIQRLNDDPSAIEDLARRELGLIMPGEKVFVIRDADRRAPDLDP